MTVTESQLFDHEPQWETLNDSRPESSSNARQDGSDEIDGDMTNEVVSSLIDFAPFSSCSEVTLNTLEYLPLSTCDDEEVINV